MLPCIVEGTEIPMTAVFSSVYSGGSVVAGYDKETLSIGFNSTVASNSSGDMIIAWNTFDLLTLRTRIKASIVYGTEEESTSKAPVELEVGSAFPTTGFIDTGNYTLIRGMDVAVDTEGNFFIAWGGTNLTGTHIYLKAIYRDGVVLSKVQVSQGFNKNYDPSIATDSLGNVIVTWSKFSLNGLFTGTRAVYARRFDNNLQALGDEFKVNVVY